MMRISDASELKGKNISEMDSPLKQTKNNSNNNNNT